MNACLGFKASRFISGEEAEEKKKEEKTKESSTSTKAPRKDKVSDSEQGAAIDESKNSESTEEEEDKTSSSSKELARPNKMADDDPGEPMVEVPENREGDPQTIEEDGEGWKKMKQY